jgi:hypothetical protein
MTIDLERLRQLVIDLQQKLDPHFPNNNNPLRRSIADLLKHRGRRIVLVPPEIADAIRAHLQAQKQSATLDA